MIIQTEGGLIQSRDNLVYVWLKGNDFIRVYNYANTQAAFGEEFGYISVDPKAYGSYEDDVFDSILVGKHSNMLQEMTDLVGATIRDATTKSYTHLAERRYSGKQNGNPTTVRRMQIKMDVIRATGILTDEERKEIEDRVEEPKSAYRPNLAKAYRPDLKKKNN